MDTEQKPDPSLLIPAPTRRRAACRQKVASPENNLTLNFRDWMSKRGGTLSRRRLSSRKVQSSVKLPSLPGSSPSPQNQTGQLVMVKDEQWQCPSELSSYNKALISVAEDKLGPSKLPDNKSLTHSASEEVKDMLPFLSANPNPHNKAPPMRPTPQPNPVPTTNTAKLQLPNTQVQGVNPFPKTSIPSGPRSGFKRKGGYNEQSRERNGNMIKKSADNLVCNLCEISCSGAVTMQQHLNGRPHKAKMEYMKLKRSCSTTRGRQGTPSRPRCDVCEIWCSDQAALEMHYKGQKHKSKLHELQLCKERGGQKLSKAPVICELCSISCMNQDLYKMHLKGRQHATKQELKRNGFH